MAQSGSHEGPLLSGVALRYASALFELAREANAVD
ncbi:MAG TPA: F0F1 ATP synthase subunit delta, partial [Microvirga sp.]|nr:F0F1 ATP synthase subunit delta [Microvirga sp.]